MAFLRSSSINKNNFLLNGRERTYAVTALIPFGKILSYKTLAHWAKVTNPRLVGNFLHTTPADNQIPCHRVINHQGTCARTNAFIGEDGEDAQLHLLIKEEVVMRKKRVDVNQSLWIPNLIIQSYWELLFRYGYPGAWPWFGQSPPHTPEEICIGSILTQNTNWRNVEYALKNLRDYKITTLMEVYNLGRTNKNQLVQLIKPAGFYNQKAERLIGFAQYIMENYSSLSNFFSLDQKIARKYLLSLKGIGKETADTMLLYAGNRTVFIVDTYTKRFLHALGLSQSEDYDELQQLFADNLPKFTWLYQDYHALIVRWGKDH